MKTIPVLLLFCLGFCMSCKKSKLMFYQGEQSIYFFNQRLNSTYVDTVYYNFATSTLQSDTLTTYVWVMGSIADHNRPFSMRVVKENTTAVEGRDYELPVADSLYIPAKSRNRSLPVVIHRAKDIYEKELKLEIELLDNDLFNTNMKVHNNYASAYQPSATRIRYTIADKLLKPAIWDANIGLLGPYSRKKFQLFVENQQLNFNKWYKSPLYTSTAIKFYAGKFQSYLNQERDKGNIVRDEDGQEMKMGILVQ